MVLLIKVQQLKIFQSIEYKLYKIELINKFIRNNTNKFILKNGFDSTQAIKVRMA